MSEYRWNGRPKPPSFDDLIADRYKDRPESRHEIRANVEAWKRLKEMCVPLELQGPDRRQTRMEPATEGSGE